MSEYIEREAAVAKITELINQSGKYTDYECGADDACYIVNHIHAADVRPVVLCRDCKHEGLLSCPMVVIEKQQMVFINHDPEFFCASGEREK